MQRCPPVTVASGFGYYVYPPVDFAIRWDGSQTEVSMPVDDEPVGWRSLAGFHNDAQLSEPTEYIASAPQRLHAGIDVFDRYAGGYPFINAETPATNLLELSTGTVVRTAPGQWLLARGMPNLTSGPWHPSAGRAAGDRLVPLARFHRAEPVMLLQPVQRDTFEAITGEALTVTAGLHNWPDHVWTEYVDMRRTRHEPARRGAYRREQRRRARTARTGLSDADRPQQPLGEGTP